MPKLTLAPLRAFGASLARGAATPLVQRAAAVVVAMLVGGWLGLLLGGNVTTSVGPVEAQLSLRPGPSGDTVVHLSPLGSVTFDTHDGPLRIEAAVERIRPEAAQRIVAHPRSLRGLGDVLVTDLRSAMTWLVVKSALSAVLGAGLFALIVYRRRWWLVGSSAVATFVLLAAAGLTGYATFNPQSIEEPRYTGLLVSAPRVVGSVQDLARNFSQYRQQLAKLVTNVSQVYAVTRNLESYEPDPSTVRVLHISDLHLNPAAWNVVHSVAEQFRVNVIVDSGDIVDNGTEAEDSYVDEISTFDVPYIFVRGNHDSQSTAEAVADQQGAVVLDGTAENVAGLRFFGARDPRFTPDPATRENPQTPSLQAAGLQLAEQLRDLDPPADIAVVHDPQEAAMLDGTVPLVLSGHAHQRSTRILQHGTRLMVEGSTGGAGIRALDTGQPTSMQLSVLYIDRETKRLQAWDGISVGGLGLSTAQITRHVVQNPDREIEPPASPSPTPSANPRGPPATDSPGRSRSPAPSG